MGNETQLFDVVDPLDFPEERHILTPARTDEIIFPDLASRNEAGAAWSGKYDVERRNSNTKRLTQGAAVRINENLLFQKQKGSWIVNPIDLERYFLQVINLEYESDTDYTYHANAYTDRGLSDYVGYVTIMAKKGRVFGRMILEESCFRIEPIGKGVSALVKESKSLDRGAKHQHAPIRERLKTGHHKLPVTDQQAMRSNGSVANEVRVLVMYTDAAIAIWDPWISANRSMAETQQALRTSLVHAGQLQLTLAGVAALPGFRESYRYNQEQLDDLPNNPTVIAAKAASKADLVVVLTAGAGLGLAITTEPGDSSLAYAFVAIDADGDLQIFSHELMHLFGGQHQYFARDGLVNVAPYAKAYKFRKYFWQVSKKSIMYISGGGPDDPYRRELYFSNPFQTLWGRPTGVIGKNDNAQQFRDLAPTVSRYVQTLPPLSAVINGPGYMQAGQTLYFTSHIVGCNLGVAYAWEYSTNGSTYFPFGVGATSSLAAPSAFNLYIRLTVICGQESSTSFLTVATRDPDCGGSIPCLTGPPGGHIEVMPEAGESSSQLSVFPNPVSNSDFLTSGILPESEGDMLQTRIMVELTLAASGDVIQQVEVIIPPSGIWEHQWSSHNLMSGKYFITIFREGMPTERRILTVVKQ